MALYYCKVTPGVGTHYVREDYRQFADFDLTEATEVQLTLVQINLMTHVLHFSYPVNFFVLEESIGTQDKACRSCRFKDMH